MRPDPAADDAVRRLISAVARRRWWMHFALSALVAASLASAIAVLSHAGGFEIAPWHRNAIAFLAGAVAMTWSRRFRTRRAAAALIEGARPSCRNLVITAEETERHPERWSAQMISRVMRGAGGATAGLPVGSVVPVHRTVAALAAALVVSALLVPAARLPIRGAAARLADQLPSVLTGVPDVRVTIEPPSYTGRAASVVTNPARLEALEGSRIRFELPLGWRVRFGSTAISTDVLAREGGYFALESPSVDDRRLIPLSVIPDRAPTVRISAPAKDLLLPDGSKSIPVQISAADDLALQSVELRFTKVSGSGEQFEFVEGSLPVSVQRSSEREWTADARLALASMKLGPGDSLVYRAVARDQRAGDAGLAASDTYFIEIAGPGQVALEGVEMPPEMERYAMSQQMIVVKLERLRKQEGAMSRAAVSEEAASIAAEQRTVRANFIFLLGGHVEDEEEEAEQSHEIQEGRLENTARKDINAAISQMTRVEQGLTALDTAAALPPARAAVESLQRAFGRSRYLLRALAVRSRLDPSRRLTGDLAGATEWRRLHGEPEPREGESARRLLDELLDLAAQAEVGRTPDKGRLQQLAESALAIDPASALWQEVARRLADAKDANAIREVISGISPETFRGIVPRTGLSIADSPLERAFRAERRQ